MKFLLPIREDQPLQQYTPMGMLALRKKMLFTSEKCHPVLGRLLGIRQRLWMALAARQIKSCLIHRHIDYLHSWGH
jgi:hypothetical protein